MPDKNFINKIHTLVNTIYKTGYFNGVNVLRRDWCINESQSERQRLITCMLNSK